jgi:hypothetical protein
VRGPAGSGALPWHGRCYVRAVAVDLDRMLERCERGQWKLDEFDWTRRPIAMGPEREREVCQYFVDMSYIERLAGALFRSLAERLEDPRLRAIFASFALDELRHSHAAARLADHFDVHHHRVYTPSIAMVRFIPYFIGMIDSLSPAFATSFILTGELILDVALLRGLNEYVDDPLARAVVERINQDESRHLAMDMHMTEHFAGASLEPLARVATNPWLGADFWGALLWGPGFFADVFFRPMAVLDPSQEQLRDVMRRLRRFYDRRSVDGNPAVEHFRGVAAFFETNLGSLLGTILEEIFRRTVGVDFAFVRAAATGAESSAPSPHAGQADHLTSEPAVPHA